MGTRSSQLARFVSRHSCQSSLTRASSWWGYRLPGPCPSGGPKTRPYGPLPGCVCGYLQPTLVVDDGLPEVVLLLAAGAAETAVFAEGLGGGVVGVGGGV